MNADVLREALGDALRRTGEGDALALKDVYQRTSAKLFGVCLRILGEPTEAEDVLQEVYTTVWRRASGFDPTRASPITWLATIARNRAIDRLRTRPAGRQTPIEAARDVADGAPSAEARLQARDGVERLDGCLGELEDRRRDAVKEAFLDGCTYEVLARRAGVPLGTMKSWIRRALAQLKVCLER